MLKKLTRPNKILIAILLFALLTRFYNLNYPTVYVFDEVYHAFTAKEFSQNHKEAWEWWTTPPPGVAYEWTHPPLAKEIMALSMLMFNTQESWAWRLPGVILGIISIYLIYLISKLLFKSELIALTASFIYSLDGLNFVQSRTGMNDIYLITFVLVSLYLLLKKKFLFSSIFLGLALSSKWTAIYFFGIELAILFIQGNFLKTFYFLLVPPIIYISSYIPFFLLGHDIETFKGLQLQMWWYHTNLKATHDYYSAWWSWPLNLKPVWYFVDYQKDGKISNIFASGNPLLFWVGIGAIIVTLFDLLQIFYKHTKTVLKSFFKHENPFIWKSIFILLISYLGFWLPWSLSPRIMFLYHYSPSVPFLSIILSYQLAPLYEDKKMRILFFSFLITFLLSFIFIYPILTGIPLPKDLLMLFFQTNLTKNPFGE